MHAINILISVRLCQFVQNFWGHYLRFCVGKLVRSTLENSLLSTLTFSTKAVLSEAPAQSKILDNDDNIFQGQTEQGGQLNLQHFFFETYEWA